MYALFDTDCAAPLAIKPAIVRDMAALAHRAMLVEVYTTPKPGLVDLANNGAHRDMTVDTFERSANAIAPWLEQFTDTGIRSAHQPVDQLLSALRHPGRQCEQDMYLATAGVNTHKGMLFSMALLCAAGGRLCESALHPPAGAGASCTHGGGHAGGASGGRRRGRCAGAGLRAL